MVGFTVATIGWVMGMTIAFMAAMHGRQQMNNKEVALCFLGMMAALIGGVESAIWGF
jgi:hypothetical protein